MTSAMASLDKQHAPENRLFGREILRRLAIECRRRSLSRLRPWPSLINNRHPLTASPRRCCFAVR